MKKVRITLVIAVIFVFSFFGSVAFATGLGNDSVLSEHIKEADGSTGQDTNTGSGIKTGHIQNNAVTSGKIADGSIAAVDISDEAITDAKISGPISHSKIEKYYNTAVVAKNGGDYNSPIDAMSSLVEWCSAPSIDNPCLLKIMPGLYDIGNNVLNMSAFVDIEGSGEKTTVIKGSGSKVINGASDSEIRFLTVRDICESSNSAAIAIYNESISSMSINNIFAEVESPGCLGGVAIYNVNASVSISKVKATVSGNSPVSSYVGIVAHQSSVLILNNIDIVTSSSQQGSASGVQSVNSSKVKMNNANIMVSVGSPMYLNAGAYSNNYAEMEITNSSVEINFGYGAYISDNAKMNIDHSIVISNQTSVFTNVDGIAFIGNTRLKGPTFQASGSITCAGVYDENYTFYASACP